MTGSRSVDYWSLQGARVLLAPYDRWDSRIPDDSAHWQRRLFPLIRGMRTAEQDGGRNLREIAAELRVAAELFEVRPEDEALGRIPRAETEDRTPQVLREIAGRLESGNWWSSEDVPLGTAELLLRFPRFSQILPIYWGQDGMAISDDMQGSTEEQMEAFFCEEMGGGSGGEDFLGFFPLLARHCVDHLKEAHSPLWTPSR